MPPLIGGLELGGTKCVCAVGNGPEDLRDELIVPTSEPEATFAEIVEFFKAHELEALGIGTFGPVDLRHDSPDYGTIVTGTKSGWQGTNVLDPFLALGVSLSLDTDVNAAAMGEYHWGVGQGCEPLVYITVGTGIGGGVLLNGKPLHGLWHPEMGHIRVQRHPMDDFEGQCPVHGCCLEGMACGPAIESRWGLPPSNLPADHLAWELVAHYLAQALLAVTYTLCPQRIILGGGVMQKQGLLELTIRRFVELQGDYLPPEVIRDRMNGFIQPPGLGGRAGVLGALALASPNPIRL